MARRRRQLLGNPVVGDSSKLRQDFAGHLPLAEIRASALVAACHFTYVFVSANFADLRRRGPLQAAPCLWRPGIPFPVWGAAQTGTRPADMLVERRSRAATIGNPTSSRKGGFTRTRGSASLISQENQLKKTFHRMLAIYLITATTFIGVAQPAQGAMISSEEVIAKVALSDRDRAGSFIDRADVKDKLEHYGVSSSDARARIAALSDDEARTLANSIDEAEAGGIVEVIVFLFLVLLITDILGFTKIFPFTRGVQ